MPHTARSPIRAACTINDNGFLFTLGGPHDTAGVVLSEPRQLCDLRRFFDRQHTLCLGELLVGRTTIAEFDLALDHPQRHIAPVLLDLAVGEPRGVGRFLRDDANLFERLTRWTSDVEGNVVDVTEVPLDIMATNPGWARRRDGMTRANSPK